MVNDLDVLEHTREIQAQIGYLPETAPLYPELSVQAYLQMMADLRQIPEEAQLERLSEAIYATGLQDHLTRPIGELSKGFRQRVGLAQAILHRPKLLILDEPTVGLDPTQIVEIRHLIKRLSQHSTVLFSTHILSEVEALCDRAIILINGEVKADARLSDLAATSDAVLVLDSAPPDAIPALESLEEARNVDSFERFDGFPAYRVYGKTDAGVDLGPAIYAMARAHNWPVRELRRDVRTLEMVFNALAMSARDAETGRGGGCMKAQIKQILTLTRKELRSYFGSPMALIFIGTFLAATLFAFFWVDTFFARGISDVRPLFRWMPVLLIFLVAALTMRQWSEEQRSGTLEILLTLPVSTTQLVLGKFLAVVALVAIALSLTIFLPLTVALLGNLDWGPVIGGYLAAVLMAAAYAAIGLFVSSRTDNQIVALISTVLGCGLFYIVGSSGCDRFCRE